MRSGWRSLGLHTRRFASGTSRPWIEDGKALFNVLTVFLPENGRIAIRSYTPA